MQEMSFSIDPELYVKANDMQMRDAEVVLRMCRRDLNRNLKPEIILDLGCGPGNTTCSVIAAYFPNCTLVGVDKSLEMINHATLHSRRENITYVMLDILDDQQLEQFISLHGRFTKVVSFYCLHWIKDQKKALENIKRLLRDEGECLLMFVAQCPVFVMYEKLAKKPEWAGYMMDAEDFIPSTQKSLHPDEDFRRLMEEAGLKVVSCKLLRQSYTFETLNELVDCMESFNPFISRLPEDEVNEYIKDCLITLRDFAYRPKREKGECPTFPYVLLVAHGRQPTSK